MKPSPPSVNISRVVFTFGHAPLRPQSLFDRERRRFGREGALELIGRDQNAVGRLKNGKRLAIFST